MAEPDEDELEYMHARRCRRRSDLLFQQPVEKRTLYQLKYATSRRVAQRSYPATGERGQPRADGGCNDRDWRGYPFQHEHLAGRFTLWSRDV